MHSKLAKRPRNVVVEAGTDITMECSLPASGSSLSWDHNVAHATGYRCRSFKARYVAKSTINDCYLTALGNYSVEGAYVCYDDKGLGAEAVAIVMGNIESLRK